MLLAAIVEAFALSVRSFSAASGLTPFCRGGRSAYSERHSAAVERPAVRQTKSTSSTR